MKDTNGKKAGKASRRAVLKGGVAFGLAGAATIYSPFVARAAGIKVRTINASGSFSRTTVIILEQQKLFEKYGVEVESLNVSDSAKILAGLIGGDGDMCCASGFNGLFPAIEKGATIKILAGAGIAPLNIMYTNKPDIKSVKDLPGRTVGTGGVGSLLHELAVGVMKKYGVDYHKVNFVNAGSSNDVFKALVGGTIDAGAAPIEFRDTAAKYKLYALPDGEFWKELPLWTNQAMYAPDKAIANNRKGIVGVMAAYAEMFRWMGKKENKPLFQKYYAEAIGGAKDDEAAFLFDFLGTPGHLATNLVLSAEQIQYVQDLNVELGVQKAMVSFDKCADMSLAQEALKLIKS